MSSNPVDRILSRLGDSVQRSGDTGNQWVALCPAHDDARHSLAVGRGKDGRALLKCYAGCSVEEVLGKLGLSLGDMFEEDDDKGKEAPAITLSLLAWDKRLPEVALTEHGVYDFSKGKGVGIPYYDEAKKRLFVRRRTALRAKDGSFQPRGVPLQAYGQWRLPAVRQGCKSLVLVEGESDCWTLWHHGFPALGLPGSSSAKTLTEPILAGIARLFIWQEPGAGGQDFVASIARKFKEIGWKGTAKVIRCEAIKDPNVLHQRDPVGFPGAFKEIVAAGVPLEVLTSAPKNVPPAKSAKAPIIPGIVADRAAETATIPPPSPAFYGLTDWGNAQRLAFRYGQDLRYCHAWKRWFVWNGQMWSDELHANVTNMAKSTVRAIYAEAGNADSADVRQRISEWANRSENLRPITAMVELAKSEPPVPVLKDDLNTATWLLNTPTGTVDLRTGAIQSHRREDLITRMVPTPYNPEATCPRWEKFLADVFAGDVELIEYVHRLLGYCLTGDVSSHLLLVFWGNGGNGKGTLLNTLLRILGPTYSLAAAAEFLMASKYPRHPTEIASLCGKHLVVCQETDDGCRLNEALIKWLTGGDMLEGRRMREDPWRFFPTHKIVLSTNYKPVIRGTDTGMWRRLRLIPFNVTFAGKAEDRGLSDKLRAEATGILAWAVRGCLDWLQNGERVPPAVLIATKNYRHDEDIVSRFIDECCRVDKDDPDLKSQASILYGVFTDWVEKIGERRRFVSQTKFSLRLQELGYERDPNRANGSFYVGLCIQDDKPSGRLGRFPPDSPLHSNGEGVPFQNGKSLPNLPNLPADDPTDFDISRFDQ